MFNKHSASVRVVWCVSNFPQSVNLFVANEIARHYLIVSGKRFSLSDQQKLMRKIKSVGFASILCEYQAQAEYVKDLIKNADCENAWSVTIVNPFLVEGIF